MRDESKADSLSLGVFGRKSRASGLSAAEVIALALSALWLLGVTIFFFVVGTRDLGAGASSGLRGLTVIFAVFMPIALIWVATMAASSARAVKEETRRLEEALDAMRRAYETERQNKQPAGPSSVERKLDQIVAAQRETGEVLRTFSTEKPTLVAELPRVSAPIDRGMESPAEEPADAAQPSLALEDNRPPPQAITIAEFILAMNFPKTSEDKVGFEAFRRAMKDHRAAGVLQASQDLLTLLSQEGIYMDDLTPDPARPELWRRFAKGERGRAIAALGGIRDRSGIALTASRMREDPIFRDTGHHFLRKFDQIFAQFEAQATDAEIVALADTRTARAFMLLGRVAGTFD